MAFNIFLNTSAWDVLSAKEQEYFAAIFPYLDGDFNLPHGTGSRIKEKFGFSPAVISRQKDIIWNIVALLRPERGAPLKGGARERDRALAIRNAVKLSWGEIEQRMRVASEIALMASPDFRRSPEFERFASWVGDLEKKNESLECDLAAIRGMLQERSEEVRILRLKLEEIAHPADDVASQSEETVKLSWEEKMILEWNLPRIATVIAFGEPPLTFKYGNEVGRLFKDKKRMGSREKNAFAKAVRALALKGRIETGPRQKHKKYPSERTGVPAPQGSRVADIKDTNLKYIWGVDWKNRILHIYFIGMHREIWGTEG